MDFNQTIVQILHQLGSQFNNPDIELLLQNAQAKLLEINESKAEERSSPRSHDAVKMVLSIGEVGKL